MWLAMAAGKGSHPAVSVLVYVAAVLDVAVSVVDVVDMVFVGNLLAVVVLGVLALVIGVDRGFAVVFAIVDVVDMIFVRDRFVSVSGKVLVIAGFAVLTGCHWVFPSDEVESQRNDNGNRCQQSRAVFAPGSTRRVLLLIPLLEGRKMTAGQEVRLQTRR